MSLRSRLLTAVLLLAAFGVLAMGAITYGRLSAFLLDRIDEQVVASAEPVARVLGSEADLARNPKGSSGGSQVGVPAVEGQRRQFSAERLIPGLLPGTYGEARNGSGARLRWTSVTEEDSTAARPAIPADVPITYAGGPARLATVDGLSEGDPQYRVMAFPARDEVGTTIVVAIPLDDLQTTLTEVRTLELLAGLVILLITSGLGLWAVRVGLRPLRTVATTAARIADEGELTGRVRPADERTEIGRLGMTLNRMLSKIERLFAERRASEERMRAFLADASHELRTPLTSIRGYAEAFRIGAITDPESLRRALGRIEDESRRMSELVDDVLVMARIDTVRELGSEPVDLAEIAAAVAGDVSAGAMDRDITLDAEPDSVVIGDRGRLVQVVSNLLRNAVVHTPDHTPVEIILERRGRWILLRVRDHGPGVEPGLLPHLFDRFWRRDPARPAVQAGGAGLGLAIVAAIVEQHGGSVNAANATGGGLALEVLLPAAPRAARDADPSSVAGAVLSAGGSPSAPRS